MPSPDEISVDVSIDAMTTVSDAVSEESISSLVTHVLAAEHQSGTWEFGIQFLDDVAMQRAHAEFMGIDTPTDIMTFPYELDVYDLGPMEIGEASVQGGDLMISVDRAADHATEAGWSTEQELRFLVIHGVLHILGWDDTTDADRAKMLARQSELLLSWRPI